VNRHAIITIAFATSVAVLLPISWKPRPWLVWNATASTPIGLYRIDRTDTFAVGDLVIVIPPEPIASFLADRGFLPRCVPLIKRVLALSRQTVCRYGLLITVGGFAMGTAREHDRRGRPLPDWQGCRTLENDKVFLMNRDEPASLDGRYFGALPVSSIVGRATPFLASNEP
jgi:conjugative transfer signal peptidase TraF